ncbi:hypothetical protein ACHAWX_000382 [Stephanocyclus meneghinianus]
MSGCALLAWVKKLIKDKKELLGRYISYYDLTGYEDQIKSHAQKFELHHPEQANHHYCNKQERRFTTEQYQILWAMDRGRT